MQALWLSLKENANCGSKLINVVAHPEKCNGRRSSSYEKENFDRKLIRHTRKSFGDVIIKGYHTRTRYLELKMGDPARNITEMIFQRASTYPSKPSRKIQKVLRVKNSIEILERFEKYREKVKESAYKQQKTHPRSIVDGNELLRFYGTTMSCCSEKSMRVSELCKDPTCRVCRMIQSNFDTEYTKKNGIRLSTNSEELSENMITLSMLKMERAAIVCRIIAGTVDNKVNNGLKEECDSIVSEAQYSESESLIVRNPSAVLPCFVIVFS
ncbi:uncharacterized protein LOC122723346 [Manihot esculenta]|uniref:Uncharacterized protein n=1 Tax=Manihot esculenta TaxID=3983 RepID=A0ACB7I1D6_MANES|nr:uncharacterized protein LOC122723346 [Manihot esculenta]KAG8658305.1 hypothetical protein MANES_03G137802v8 [Manihot esculenta]